MAVIILGFGAAGCHRQLDQAEPCNAGMPTEAQLLAQPAFASLKHHVRVDYDVARGPGYDLWADSNFGYRVGLLFSLAPRGRGRGDDDLCVSAVAFRVAIPAKPAEIEQLRHFTRILASKASFDAAPLQLRVDELIDRDEKYRRLFARQPVSVEAGRVIHPVRGDFFVITFRWESS